MYMEENLGEKLNKFWLFHNDLTEQCADGDSGVA